MTASLRPPAVPLATADPYFSVWSFSDHLNEDVTRHWTGKPHGMTGLLRIDGASFLFMGNPPDPDGSLFRMEQKSLAVRPLTTAYVFEGGGVRLTALFTTPLLPQELSVLSRPVSYLCLTAQSADGAAHKVGLYLDVTGEWCVNTPDQAVIWGQKELRGLRAAHMGTQEQNTLGRDGDDLRIDWGYVWLCAPEDSELSVGGADGLRGAFMRGEALPDGEKSAPRRVDDGLPSMACACCLDCGADAPASRLILLAYDDILSVEYFGNRLPAYWRKEGLSFEQLLETAAAEYPALMERCDRFDEQLIAEATASGGERYADVISLSFRQAIAAHKLVRDEDGSALFFSKENFSNGCMATVDVTYPSAPLFLLFNPELLKGMLRPVFRYAAGPDWPYDFAPHDVGRYPRANGQAYHGTELEYQMPVEECGNMLILTAAVCLAEKDASFAAQNRPLLEEWAAYLTDKGMDPANQLCTDDFAGHLAHNVNLSVKAILGVASWAVLCGLLGERDEAHRQLTLAKEMAAQWMAAADEGDHYGLTFDQPGGWSQKYNLIWDRVFGLNVFPPEVRRRETAFYLTRQNRYGLPLDNRKSYTKADWILWTACLADSREAFLALSDPLWTYLDETPSRVPFGDWYDTVTARQEHFQARSVVGGIFIKLLLDRGLSCVDPGII